VHGNDFYASPRVSPDGQYLAWLSWNHPNMPWDSTELWVGKISQNGSILYKTCIAGSGGQESIFQPEWWMDDTLYFVSDRSEWWNLYRWQPDQEIESVLEMDAEFGRPQWAFKMSTYGFLSSHRLACTYTKHGIWHLGVIDLTSKRLIPIRSPYTYVNALCVDASHNAVLIIAGSPTEADALVRLNLDHPDPDSSTKHRVEVLRISNKAAFESGYISIPQEISYPAGDHKKAHAFFYPPKNQDYTALQDELPPLLVISHGGPTSSAVTSLNLSIQFWTSRGFAVLDVNYGGSTGYGRSYRQRLLANWGIVDVQDCVNGALFLVEQGKVDFARLAIRGGSAGGYTTLCALTFFNVFKAGASYYGVSDLEALTMETHKFESHDLDNLVGPYPAQKELYYARSPIHNISKISCPVIFFQGLDDKVVLPNQSEKIVNGLQDAGLPVAYVSFEGEGHGFRKAENIKRSLDAELYFYGRIFNFDTGEIDPPLPIQNL
jgi:dipeptidyl aminopeptidase/acylaminoacyl peptidase